FEFLDGSLEGEEECRQKSNISPEEYQNFFEFDNVENVLNETVELKYKCHVKCVMEKQPEKWLNDQGQMDLKQMSVSSEAEEDITKCMDQADEEPCSYAFKLVICALKSDIQALDYDSSEEYVETLEEEDLFELTTQSG
ncbi:hypothetical protein KR038_010206, partial [Drosophila bunnanda]